MNKKDVFDSWGVVRWVGYWDSSGEVDEEEVERNDESLNWR